MGDLLARAGVGRPSARTGHHPIDILTAELERQQTAQDLFVALSSRTVAVLDLCDDPDLSDEAKVDAIRRTLTGLTK